MEPQTTSLDAQAASTVREAASALVLSLEGSRRRVQQRLHMAIELARRSGLSNDDVAELLGIPPRSVSRRFPRIELALTDFSQERSDSVPNPT